MDMTMRNQADRIVAASIRAVQPDDAVARALKGVDFPGRVLLVAAGKAAWQMPGGPDRRRRGGDQIRPRYGPSGKF